MPTRVFSRQVYFIEPGLQSSPLAGTVPRYDYSIKFALVLLVTICMVPASLIAVVMLSFDYSRAQEARIESSVTTARAIAYSVDKEFANTEASLRALATSPSLTRRDLP